MIKSMKKYFTFLFIVSFITSFINTMEVVIKNTDTSNQRVKKKKRKNRKKSLRFELKKESKEQVQDNSKQDLEPQINKLREAGRLDNIYKLLPMVDQLRGLNLLANLFLMQSWMIKELKAISFHSKELLETADEEPLCCFSISDDQETMCGQPKGSCKKVKDLLTPEAKALALDLVAPMMMSEDFWDNPEQINKIYQISKESIGNENEEISCIGAYVKNKISRHWLDERITLLWDDIVASLSEMKYERNDLGEKINALLLKNTLSNLLAQWFIENKIFIAAQKLLPQFIEIVSKIKKLNRDFDLYCGNNDDFWVNRDDADVIDKSIKEIINLYEPFEKAYEEIYQIILSQVHDQGKCYRIVFLAPSIDCVHKNLDVPLMSTDFIDFDNENKRVYDYIVEAVSSYRKKNQSNTAFKKKKKSRRRNNKKKLPNEEKQVLEKSELFDDNDISTNLSNLVLDSSRVDKIQPELIELPNYTQRILNWFDSSYIEEISPDTESLLYHTYSLLADFFIQKYGKKVIQQNRTNSSLEDIAYYMPGYIKYKNGLIQHVLFGICFGEDACYHRGYTVDTNPALLKEFELSKFKYDFPDLSQELIIEKKKIDLPARYKTFCQDLEYKESSFYIEIYDSKNEMTLILFKPT